MVAEHATESPRVAELLEPAQVVGVVTSERESVESARAFEQAYAPEEVRLDSQDLAKRGVDASDFAVERRLVERRGIGMRPLHSQTALRQVATRTR